MLFWITLLQNTKNGDEITSWYEGFVFTKDDLSIFYFNMDAGDDRHCFEIKQGGTKQRGFF